MTVYYTLKPGRELTPEQIAELEALKDWPEVYDEENPPLTDEELAKMRHVGALRKARRRKQTVTLRISQRSLDKARMLGKGYTSVLSRILEDVLSDNEKIQKYL